MIEDYVVQMMGLLVEYLKSDKSMLVREAAAMVIGMSIKVDALSKLVLIRRSFNSKDLPRTLS